MSEKNHDPIRIDHYEDGDSVHVFVNGHALCRASSTVSVAYDLAKSFGQKEIVVTTYGKGLPVKSLIDV